MTDEIKELERLTEEAIKIILDMPADDRCISLAVTNYEQGWLWAVRALSLK